MSRRHFAASSRPSSRVPPPPKASEAQIESYLKLCMGTFNKTRDEVIESAIEMCGSVETAARGVGAVIDMGKAALAEAFPEGMENSKGAIGRKPRQGEGVKFFHLRPNLSIRIWDGDLESSQSFAFDFVDGKCRYIKTPKDIKIFTMPTPFSGPQRVLSIEEFVGGKNGERLPEFARAALYSPFVDNGEFDVNWETYLITEGTNLRIVQRGRPDCFVTIPMRIPNYNIVPLQPWAL